MNYKHRAVLSSYSDLSKISSNVKIIHFRKFISKKLLKIILCEYPDLREISLSKYASKRLNNKCIEILSKSRIQIKISLVRGRPNELEIRNINMNYKLIE